MYMSTKPPLSRIDQIMQVVKAHPDYGCRRIGAALGLSRDVVQATLAKAGVNLDNITTTPTFKPIEQLTLSEKEQAESKASTLKAEIKAQQERANYWRSQVEAKDKELSIYKAVWDHVPSDKGYKMPKGSNSSESIPVLLASDWHSEEPVDPRTINGVNEYSLDIADASIKNLATRALKLINLQRAGTRVDHMVLWLGGDFITGHIHDENKSLCSLTPIEAVLWVEDRIYSMIKFLLDEGGFKQITIPCSCGNHARTTDRKNIANQSITSYEWAIYNHLSRQFKNDPRVKFVLTPSYHCIVELFDKYKIRFHHGDAIKFGGGIGGLTIPLNKAIARWDAGGRETYLDCMGHYHTYTPGRRVIVNGSVIGYNAYALEIGASVEPPTQTLFFIEKSRGLTSIAPVFVR